MAKRTITLRGGHVVDPVTNTDRVADVVVEDGIIVEIGHSGKATSGSTIDVSGLVVAPGLIDVHVHLREPGQVAKETLETGTAAAAAGGFTTIFCMPNTVPALDRPAIIGDLTAEIKRRARVRVNPIAAITRDRAGLECVDFGALARAGVVGFSDDGDTTANSALMRQALAASRDLGLPIMVHCEDRTLAGGAMHEGAVSTRLAISGIPPEAEEIIIARDLALAQLTGGWLHVCHVSTGRGAALVRQAKRDGVPVTAEVMPHHLLMSDAWVEGNRTLLNVDEPVGEPAPPADPNTKVNPPLRSSVDTGALLAAVQDGTFDVVATDHAPHASSDKVGMPFARAAFGMSGLEFALPLMLALVRAEKLTLTRVIQLLSTAPARVWNLSGGRLVPGAPADIVVFDPAERWTVQADHLQTKSANTPLLGMELQGRVRLTLVGGEERYRA